MRMFLANSCKCSLLTRGNEALKPKDIHTANKEIRDQTKISASLGAKKDCLTPAVLWAADFNGSLCHCTCLFESMLVSSN